MPKLRGFKNRFRIEYEVVNVGLISALAETGVLDMPEIDGKAATSKSGKPAPVTVTPDILAAAGLVRTLNKPLKILGQGEVTRPLFIVADAFSKTATAKIEAAGGTAQVLEFPTGDVEQDDETAVTVVVKAPAKAPKEAAPTETLPPTSSADEAGSEA